jgi:hypothetical protein
VLKRKRLKTLALRKKQRQNMLPAWTRAGMLLTFRAEVMPGREASERTYTVLRLLASGRVELIGLSGQHGAAEFEPARA